jgi:16S rRNA processing protein RimM
MPPKNNKLSGIKSIARKDFTAIGTIDKTHGTKGEMRISMISGKSLKAIKEWAFLEIQGKPVPFSVGTVQATFDDAGILKLNELDTVEQASRYIGYTLLAPIGKRKKNDLYTEDDFTGFKLVDQTLGDIGVVEAIEEFPNQLLIRTTFNGQEVYIPAVEAFIEEINEKTKTIHLTLPEGLLDI